ncbi:MAG: DUF4124 domain-containing protein [Steroidobacteraceae bacterium]
MRKEDIDFLPWILGGFLVAAGAIAAVVAIQPPTKIAPAATTEPVLAADPMPSPAVVAPPSPLRPNEPTARPALPPGQVWQCEVDGQKTFSDSPCGAGASIRQLNPVNGMDPAPPPAWAYPSVDRGYAPPPTTVQSMPDAANDDSGGEPVYLVNERARREHRPLHRHDHRPTRHN